jgi:LysM repeat protein
MSKKDSAQEVINDYKKKQQWGPFLIGALAVLLVVVGIFIVVFSLTSNPGKPLFAFMASKTPTPTNTNTPTPVTPTLTSTNTETPTLTPTITLTPTASGPFEYVVQENDTCYALATKFNTDLQVLIALNEPTYGANCIISQGAKILIPPPGAQLPTSTPVDLTKLAKGSLYKGYKIQSGDTLGNIATRFNSTIDAIMKQNKIDDANAIQLGQLIDIPVNIATAVPTRTVNTPTPTLPPASVSGTQGAGTAAPTVAAPSATVKP